MAAEKYLDIQNKTKLAVKTDAVGLSDSELIKITREGEADRFSQIIERYQGKLFAYLYRLIGDREEARDLLQDVFIKVYKNLNSFDLERKFSSWIYRIAHNEAVNRIKKRSLKRFISWEDLTSTKDKLEASNAEDGADRIWARKERIQEVDDAMNRLPVKYKQVLLLRYYADKTYEEIGDILDKPINTVGTLINRAKKKLEEEIKNIQNRQ